MPRLSRSALAICLAFGVAALFYSILGVGMTTSFAAAHPDHGHELGIKVYLLACVVSVLLIAWAVIRLVRFRE